jgi:hypothetical protein
LNHALTVTVSAGSSAALSATFTCPLWPSKASPGPKTPSTQDTPPKSTPLLPLPELSATVVPWPSSSFHTPMGPLAASAGEALSAAATSTVATRENRFSMVAAMTWRKHLINESSRPQLAHWTNV